MRWGLKTAAWGFEKVDSLLPFNSAIFGALPLLGTACCKSLWGLGLRTRHVAGGKNVKLYEAEHNNFLYC